MEIQSFLKRVLWGAEIKTTGRFLEALCWKRSYYWNVGGHS